MYGANKRLLYVNLAFFGCTILAEIGLAVFGLPKFKYIPTQQAGQTGCHGDGETPLYNRSTNELTQRIFDRQDVHVGVVSPM